MVGECEICGRRIKTGRKYCWEHRRTSQSEGLREMGLLNKADKYYIKYRQSQHLKYILLGEALIIFIFWIYSKISGVKFIDIFVWLFGVCLFFYSYYSIFIIIKAKKERNERAKIYQDFIRGIIEADREEKEFKKSLLR
jgi:hypothetical protein